MKKLSQKNAMILLLASLGANGKQTLKNPPEVTFTKALKCGDAISFWMGARDLTPEMKAHCIKGDPFVAMVLGLKEIDEFSDEPVDLYNFTKLLNAAFHSLMHMQDWDGVDSDTDPDRPTLMEEYFNLSKNPFLRLGVGVEAMYEMQAEMRGVPHVYYLLSAWFGKDAARELTVRYVNEKLDKGRTVLKLIRDKHYDDTDEDFITHYVLDVSEAMQKTCENGVPLPGGFVGTEGSDAVLQALVNEIHRLSAAQG